MTKTLTRRIIILVILGLAVAVGFYYFYYYRHQINYLIPGVPYYGFYNHYFDADSTAINSVATILGYWGDEVNFNELRQKVSDEKIDRVKVYLALEKFFQEKGYETYRYLPAQSGDEIKEIKKFVNPQKRIPVIVYQKRCLDQARIGRGFRVVIGIFDKEKKIVVHDHDFGNNYEISYKDFESMYKLIGARGFLAVWPSKELTAKLKGPDYSQLYPKRWKVMDELGDLLMKGYDANWFANFAKQYPEALKLVKEIINDPKFEYFPPALRIRYYEGLAYYYTQTNNFDEAIRILSEKAIPLNHDLSQPYGEWGKVINTDRMPRSYYMLGYIYHHYKKDKELAQKNYEEALKIDPNFQPAQKALQQLKEELK